MELPLWLLLVASFSSVGLVSLWAATSRLHWFLRAAVLLAIVVLLAQLESAGPLALFGLQGLAVLLAMTAVRIWSQRRASGETDAEAPDGWRFSLVDSLLATLNVAVLTATLTAVVRRSSTAVDEFDAIEWPVVCVGGIGAGFITLLAAWGLQNRRRLAPALAMMALLAAGLGVAVKALEPAFMENLRNQLDDDFLTSDSGIPWYAWATVFAASGFATAVACSLNAQAIGLKNQRYQRWWAVVMAALVAALPTYVYIRLLSRLPVPVVEIPNPNGIDDIVAAGKALDVRLINLADESPVGQVAAEVVRLKANFDVGERGIRTQCVVPLKYTMDDIDTDYFSSCRTLARAFSARAGVAFSDGRVGDAVRDFDNNLELADACHAGGLAIHFIVAAAIDGIAHGDIWDARKEFDQEQCKQLVASLQQVIDSAEPADMMLGRERAWTENATGFYSRLSLILADLQGGPWIDEWVVINMEPRRRAVRELLKLELAIRAFQLKQGRLPEQLEELTPEWIATVPVDPFDAMGGALRYRLRDDGYDLYSAGPNGVDDDGVVIEDENSPGNPQQGDYRLDAHFSDRD